MVHYRLCAFADEADPALEGQIRAMRDNGIGLLEMRGVNGKNVSHLTPAEAREVKNILDSADIRVFSLGSPAGKTDIHDSFDKEKEQFLRLLETADIVGAECIRLFSFYGTNGDPAYRDEVLLRLSRFAELEKDTRCGSATRTKKAFTATLPTGAWKSIVPCRSFPPCLTPPTSCSAKRTP